MKKVIIVLLIIFTITYIVIKLGLVSITIRNTDITDEKWREDVTFLSNKLEKGHYNVFHNIDKGRYDLLFDNLKNDISSLSSEEIMIRIMEILGEIGDSHTTLSNFVLPTDEKIPLELYWFQNGLYIIQSELDQIDLIGKRVNAINGMLMEDIFDKVKRIVPYENMSLLYWRLPSYLTDPRVLEYFKISNRDEVVFELIDKHGHIEYITMTTKKINSIKYEELPNGAERYLNNNQNYYKYIEDKNIMYLHMGLSNLKSKYINQMFAEMKEKGTETLIVDLRNNVGGTHFPNNPLIKNILRYDRLNKRGRLFVIVGRRTFSSGLLYALSLKENAEAIIYGEPTGGKPNHYGDIRNIILPNSKLTINYSTKFFNMNESYNDTLLPDEIVENSIDSFIEGKDLVLEKILDNLK